MGFWSKVIELADEPYNKKEDINKEIFDKNLSGIHIYNKSKIQKGMRFYDGNFIDAITGKIIYNFNYKYLGYKYKNYYFAQQGYEKKSWGMFNLDGSKVWIKNEPIHHEILVSENETIFTFIRETKKYKGREVDFDVIVEYDFLGNELNRFSLYDNLKDFQKYHSFLELDLPRFKFLPFLDFAKRKRKSPWGGYYCYYHLNSLNIIPENKNSKDSRFQKGNWLISFRHGSMIFILDKKTKKVVWSKTQKQIKEEIQGQHTPTFLENGNILLLDNGRYRKYSRIIELNPKTDEIVWEYKNETSNNKFFSLSQGNCQKLENGNILVSQSESGRCFEIDYKTKEIVWEFYHPEKQSEKNSTYKKSFGKRQWIYRMNHYNYEDL